MGAAGGMSPKEHLSNCAESNPRGKSQGMSEKSLEDEWQKWVWAKRWGFPEPYCRHTDCMPYPEAMLQSLDLESWRLTGLATGT